MKAKRINCCMLGSALVVLSVPMLVRAEIPLSFNTTAQTNVWCSYPVASDSDSGTNYASCQIEGDAPDPPLSYSARSTVSCHSGIDATTIDLLGIAIYSHIHGGVGGKMHISGELLIGESSSCPAGTPVLLSVEGNMGDLFASSVSGYEDYINLEGVSPHYSSDGECFSFSIPAVAGDSLSITFHSEFEDSSEFNGFSENTEINFSCVVVPEPASALLLLAGLPMIRRR